MLKVKTSNSQPGTIAQPGTAAQPGTDLQTKLNEAKATIVEKDQLITTLRAALDEHENRIRALEHVTYGGLGTHVGGTAAKAAVRATSPRRFNGTSGQTAPHPINTSPQGSSTAPTRRSPAVAERARRERERRRPTGRRS